MRTLAAVLVAFLLLSGAATAKDEEISYSKIKIRGTTVHVVTVDLNAPGVEVRPLMAPPGHTQQFKSLLGTQRPTVAITGTFFDPASRTTIGNLVSNGRLLAEGHVGSAIVMGRDRQAKLEPLEGTMGRHRNWTDYYFAISGGPTLIEDGQLCISPKSEGFRDQGLYGPRQRAALGITADNRMILLTTAQPASLHQLARILKTLGAVNAINLDGGSSSALFYRGAVLTSPGRSLTNLVAIYTDSSAPTEAHTLANVYRDAYKHYLEGRRLAQQGSLPKAQSRLRQAVTMAPDQARYWEALAEVEQLQGNLDKAVEGYLQAASLHLERSQTEDGRRCAEHVLNLAPDHLAAQTLLDSTETR